MAILNTIVKDIEKNKNLEMNLSRYGSEMMSLYYRYSYTRLAYNYFTMQEMLQYEGEEDDISFSEAFFAVDKIIKSHIIDDDCRDSGNQGADREKAVVQIDNLRNDIISSMKVLTAYADCLQVYEYILNRLDRENPNIKLKENYSDEAFTNELIQYIFADRDNAVINAKIADMIGQLPVRMTRQRYFEIIKDAFSLYRDSDRESVDSFVYMLRSLATLDRPDGFGEKYPDIYRVIDEFGKYDFEKITKEQYNVYESMLLNTAENVRNLSDKYISLQEIINDVYVILLSKAYAVSDIKETENCNLIITSAKNPDDNAFDALEALEGRQEQIYEIFAKYDYLIEESGKYKDIIESTMLTAVYNSLSRITKLVSTSSFIELNKSENNEQPDDSAGYAESEGDRLISDLIKLFDGKQRRFIRSVMAVTLSALPVFVGNTDELIDYIRHSLASCSDETEKGVCVSLLTEIMKEYND